MKKLLVAIAIVSFCADANVLLSGDTLQGIASVITATKGNNNYQQQGYQNGLLRWNSAPNLNYSAQQNKKVQNNQQLQAVLAQNGWVADSQDIVRDAAQQIQGYVTKKGMIVNPQGIVIWGPQDKLGKPIGQIPQKIKNIFEQAGIQVYAGTPLNQSSQWGSSQTLVNSQSNLSLWNPQPVLNNGQPASSDPQALPRFLKIIGEMAEDSLTLLEANIENEKVRNLVYKLLQLMIQSCTQQAADRSKLMKMRDSILELAKKADATQIAEKFDTIVKSTYKDNDLLISEDVEEREAERKKKLRKRKAQEENEEETSNKRRKANDDFDEGYDGDDEYVSDYY